ncbi:hypothetical protein HOK021_41330 [Streptomyces hygroscopicus]|nr:hypothetical protein HOK021_41330 [Streptomyces hygroscopicus]
MPARWTPPPGRSSASEAPRSEAPGSEAPHYDTPRSEAPRSDVLRSEAPAPPPHRNAQTGRAATTPIVTSASTTQENQSQPLPPIATV